MAARGPVLVINAGSSSIKYAVFDGGLEELAQGMVEIITEGSARPRGGEKRPPGGAAGHCPAVPPDGSPDHAHALSAILKRLANTGLPLSSLAAAAHRVVHGGTRLTAPVRLTPETLEAIRACVPLAPLHNPHNLAAIEALARLVPTLPQFASFDTAFHAGNPEVARRYALPAAEEEALGIRRYGFHGLSYAGLTTRLPEISGQPLPRRLLALHLGNGASLCAIRDGRSVATTMGYSPLEGLTMGTRCGSIDGNAVLRMVDAHGTARTREILNFESGLLGLGGSADMRTLAQAGTPQADFAIAHFCYWALQHAGAMIMAMGGLDAIAFTGGIGENDARVRARIMAGLDWLGLAADARANAAGRARLHVDGSRVGAWVVPADEAAVIASDALRLLRAEA